MARKSGPKQLKRAPAPRSWIIHRKQNTWAPNPRPGAHARQRSIPLILLLREMLGYAKTSREAENIVNAALVSVDGKIRRDSRFPIGLMDLVSIKGLNANYRVLPRPKQGLSLVEVPEQEVSLKVCKIVGKKIVRGGNVQLTLHDGRTLRITPRLAQQKRDEAYSVGGAVQFSVPDQRIIKYIPFQIGVLGLVTNGKNEGLSGRITTVSPGTSARQTIAKIESQETVFETPAAYVLPIGTESPVVSIKS